jgi:copper chaperone
MTELTLIQTEEATDAGCACCAAPSTDIETTPTAATTAEEAAMSENAVVAEYTVTGMTCGHCVASVTEEVGALAGVRDVAVDLATGKVTVTSAAPLEVAAVEAAVDEAGYQLVG